MAPWSWSHLASLACSLSILGLASASAIKRTHLAGSHDLSARQADSTVPSTYLVDLGAQIAMNAGPPPVVGSGTGSYWTPANESISFPIGGDSGSGGAASNDITISITHRGRTIPEDELFIGFIAAENLIYQKQLPIKGAMPRDGTKITFKARLAHAISLDPLYNQAVPWGDVVLTIQKMGLFTFNTKLGTEVIFRATQNGKAFLEGYITNPNEVEDSPQTA